MSIGTKTFVFLNLFSLVIIIYLITIQIINTDLLCYENRNVDTGGSAPKVWSIIAIIIMSIETIMIFIYFFYVKTFLFVMIGSILSSEFFLGYTIFIVCDSMTQHSIIVMLAITFNFIMKILLITIHKDKDGYSVFK